MQSVNTAEMHAGLLIETWTGSVAESATPVLIEGGEVKAVHVLRANLNAHAVERGGCGYDGRARHQHVPLGHVQQVQPVVAQQA